MRDIRWKRVKKEEAAVFISQCTMSKPTQNIRLFRDFMGIKKNAMDYILDSMKDPDLFDKESNKSKLYISIASSLSNNEQDYNDELYRQYSTATISSIRDRSPYTHLTGHP